MSAHWLVGNVNADWFKRYVDPLKGGIKDGSPCPVCNQPRLGSAFYYKKENVYVSLCTNCRRKVSGWLTEVRPLD